MIVNFFVENWQREDIFCYPEENKPKINVFEAKLRFHGDSSLCETGPLVLEEIFPESTVYFMRSRISEVREIQMWLPLSRSIAASRLSFSDLCKG
jgi:hypothetical protein